MSDNLKPQDILSYVTELASAYIASHDVEPEQISGVVKKAFVAMAEVLRDVNNMGTRPALSPAVPVEESVHDDYIICLEDGKKLQMLKRHLNTVYGLSLEQYKERWGLPADYPVVAPRYAKRRSEIAKTTGLGNTGRKKLRVA